MPFLELLLFGVKTATGDPYPLKSRFVQWILNLTQGRHTGEAPACQPFFAWLSQGLTCKMHWETTVSECAKMIVGTFHLCYYTRKRTQRRLIWNRLRIWSCDGKQSDSKDKA